MKLYEQGVYLLHGTELIADGPEAQAEIKQKTGHEVAKSEAAKQTMAYAILEKHNTSGNMENLQIKFDKLTSHDITYVVLFRQPEHPALRNFRFHMCLRTATTVFVL